MNTPPTQPFRQLRRNSGLSIRVLSTLTGINRGRLSIIERGVMPTPDEASRIISALTTKSDIPTVIGSSEPTTESVA